VLIQGNTIVVGRKSPNSLYNEKIASFEDDEGLYDQKDAAGFIKLQVWPASNQSTQIVASWDPKKGNNRL